MSQAQDLSFPLDAELYLLIFETQDDTKKRIASISQALLKRAGLIVRSASECDEDDDEKEEECVLTVRVASENLMEATAENMRLMVRIKETRLEGTTDPDSLQREFSMANRHAFSGAGRKGTLFTPAQRYSITLSLLESIEVGSLLAKEIVKARFREQKMNLDDDEGMQQIKQRSEAVAKESLLAVLKEDGYLRSVCALHAGDGQHKIWKMSLRSLIHDPVHKFREYYGEEVALYFAFMQFFTLWLLPCAVVGFAMWLYRPAGLTVDESPYLPFFGLFMVFWGIFFIKYWRRTEAGAAAQWGTLSYVDDDDVEVRAGYEGEIRISPVTGHPERYSSPWRRYFGYLVSVVVTFFMLCVAVTVMVLSFNLQGYMSDKDSVLHVPLLHQFAEPGRIFDPNGPMYFMLIPVVLHSLVIMQLNNLYRLIAERLTELENHRTDAAHENALILKRFLFEAFDCYLPLFYLAFYECDIVLLRLELVALYTTDSIRRVVTESILPWAMNKASVSMRRRKMNKAKRGGEKVDVPQKEALIEISERDEQETFDDYLEMIVQFGYITLFASAFPLASALSVVCNLIEVRSDAFKLSFVNRKPDSKRSSNIGTWYAILASLAWLSIFTNCMIFGFSSEQMGEWFPSWFRQLRPEEKEQDVVLEAGNVHHGHDEVFKAGWGRYAVGLVFGIEHVIFLFAFLVSVSIPNLPEWVRLQVNRRRHELAEQAIVSAKGNGATAAANASSEHEVEKEEEEEEEEEEDAGLRRRRRRRRSSRGSGRA